MCDYEIQRILVGQEAFLDQTAAKLGAAAAAGRRAVFVGPKECVQALRERVGEAPVELLTFCAFGRFTALLLGAEYAFYWNAVSHSILFRLLNGLPVFLFDRGHLARGVRSIYPRIVDWYYQGWEPIYLDPGAPLRADELRGRAGDYRAAADGISRHLRRSPTPAEVIDRCLSSGRGSVAGRGVVTP